MANPDLRAELSDSLVDERGGRPVAGGPADPVEEVAQDLRAMWRVGDLRMELHRVARAAIGHRGDRHAGRAREDGESARRATHGVAVADPGALLRGEALEDPAAIANLDGRRPVLALSLGDDIAPEEVRHELHAVADAEDRELARDDPGVDARGARLVHARGAARENDADHVPRAQLGRRHVVRKDLAIHA